MLERIAHAKVNLALHVTGQRSDGYHLLDSLVVFTEFGDKITINEANNASSLVTLVVDGPFSQGLEIGANNLVSRAALALGSHVADKHGKPKPVEIRLTKNLPIASGLGGGSADAAATLLSLQEFWGSEINLEKHALDLGADIPICLHSKPLRAQGIGDEITMLKTKAPLNMVLVNPSIEVPTPSIFKQLTKKNNAPISDEAMTEMPAIANVKYMRNDLQALAVGIEPAIAETLNAISQTNAQLARMSGSGATCFGVFNTQEQAQDAAIQIKLHHPNWWCIATTTTVS